MYYHAAGILVLTPSGKISRYLLGVDFLARDLRLALVEASANKIGSPADQILLYCFHYDPSNGQIHGRRDEAHSLRRRADDGGAGRVRVVPGTLAAPQEKRAAGLTVASDH